MLWGRDAQSMRLYCTIKYYLISNVVSDPAWIIIFKFLGLTADELLPILVYLVLTSEIPNWLVSH